jgi:hypothetical protein
MALVSTGTRQGLGDSCPIRCHAMTTWVAAKSESPCVTPRPDSWHAGPRRFPRVFGPTIGLQWLIAGLLVSRLEDSTLPAFMCTFYLSPCFTPSWLGDTTHTSSISHGASPPAYPARTHFHPRCIIRQVLPLTLSSTYFLLYDLLREKEARSNSHLGRGGQRRRLVFEAREGGWPRQ